MLISNLICTALVDTRWGTIGLVGSLFSTFILLSLNAQRRSRVVLTLGLLVALFCSAIFLGYASGKPIRAGRVWKAMRSLAGTRHLPASAITALTALSRSTPGKEIDHSNGCRASFFHQGWKLVGEHPAGIGPRKEAFRYILRRDTQDMHITIPHSHYGLIEFGLQNGVVGIAGWLILLAGCWYIGWREFRHGKTMVGLFLLLFTIGFFSRTMVDHNLKDHYLEQYMMLTGLLIGIAALRPRENYSPND